MKACLVSIAVCLLVLIAGCRTKKEPQEDLAQKKPDVTEEFQKEVKTLSEAEARFASLQQKMQEERRKGAAARKLGEKQAEQTLKTIDLFGKMEEDRKKRDALVKDWREHEQELRQRAERLRLRRHDDPEVIKENIAELEHDNDDVREGAARSLSVAGAKANDAVPALVRTALNDSSPNVLKEAALALGAIGVNSPDVVSALVKVLERQEDEPRESAIWALSTLGARPREALPALIRALESDHVMLRIRAARLLGEMGTEAGNAAPALTKLLEDKNPGVVRAAGESLRLIAK